MESALAGFSHTYLTLPLNSPEYFVEFLETREKLISLSSRLLEGGVCLKDICAVLCPAEYLAAIARMCIAAGHKFTHENLKDEHLTTFMNFYKAARKWGDAFWQKKRFLVSKLSAPDVRGLRTSDVTGYEYPEPGDGVFDSDDDADAKDDDTTTNERKDGSAL